MKRTWILVVLVALSLGAVACGDSNDDSGGTANGDAGAESSSSPDNDQSFCTEELVQVPIDAHLATLEDVKEVKEITNLECRGDWAWVGWINVGGDSIIEAYLEWDGEAWQMQGLNFWGCEAGADIVPDEIHQARADAFDQEPCGGGDSDES